MGKVYKNKFYVQWLMENEDVARKAITRAIEDGEVATSFGVCNAQYEGYDFEDGEITYTSFRIGDRELCLVGWSAEAQDAEKDYWLSPYCFEDVETFEMDGSTARGEECDFGLRS